MEKNTRKKTTETDKNFLIKQSLLTIRKLRGQLEEEKRKESESIAIVGMACRFPGGCNSPEAFWNLLKEGREGIIDVPSDRWDVDEYYDPTAGTTGKMYVKQGNFIQHNISEFDAKFFKISPAEANTMDPQQRQLLEVCWESLENAGQNPLKLRGSKTGVFIGISSGCEYAKVPQDEKKVNQYTGTGTLSSIAAGRISYTFGWNGPSLAIDTACSSSLVSTNLAIESLRNGECNMALTGGVSLMISPIVMSSLCTMNAISEDGRCKPFDANGSGYGRAEGCGVVVLKRLSDAERDGDTIYALIRGGAVNNDGESSGITVPNGKAQQMVINSALNSTGVKPEDISYLEAHGTGTPLGDPIEFDTINKVFGTKEQRSNPLIVGTIKGNIGHLEAAAGIASLIKVALCLYHKEIPRLVNHNELNNRINLNKIPAMFPLHHMTWDVSDGKERIAGINSFGFSGTNVHMILSEAPARKCLDKKMPSSILVLTAKEEKALVELIRRYDDYFNRNKDLNLNDVCFVSNVCRADYANRAVFLGNSASDMQEGFRQVLQEAEQKESIYNNAVSLLGSSKGKDRLNATRTLFDELNDQKVYTSKIDDMIKPKFAFLFSGDDNEFLKSAASLSNTFETFKYELTSCLTGFEQYYGSLVDKLDTIQNADLTKDIRNAYVFSIEYALMKLVESFGIIPEITTGERAGAYITAVATGILSIESAIKHFVEAQNIANQEKDIKFVRIFLEREKVDKMLQENEGKIFLSAVYSQNEIVISGINTVIDTIVSTLELQGVKCNIEENGMWPSGVYVKEINSYRNKLSSETYSKAKYRYVSVFSAETIRDPENLKLDLTDHTLVSTIEYEKSIESIYQQGYRFFIELGVSPYRDESSESILKNEDVVYIKLLQDSEHLQGILQGLAKFVCLGAHVNWENFYKGYDCRKIELPNYPFSKSKYWVAPPSVLEDNEYDLALHSKDGLAGREISFPTKQKQFRFIFTYKNFPELADNTGVVHVGYFMEMLESTMKMAYGNIPYIIKNMVFISALMVLENEIKEVILLLEPNDNDDEIMFYFHSRNANQKNWSLHVKGALRCNAKTEYTSLSSIDELKAICGKNYVEEEDFYKVLKDNRGFNFGKSVRWNDKIWYNENEAIACFRNRRDSDGKREYALGLHPGIMDSCAQIYNFLSMLKTPEGKKYMVKSMEKVQIDSLDVNGLFYGYIKLSHNDGKNGEIQGSLKIIDEIGRTSISIGSIMLKEFDEEKLGMMKGLMSSTTFSKGGKDTQFLEKYIEADAEHKLELVTEYVKGILAMTVDAEPETIDVSEDLDNYGFDSMVGVSFINKLLELLGIEISYGELVQCKTLINVARTLLPVLPGGALFAKEDINVDYDTDMSLEHWIYHYKENRNAKLRIFCFPNGYRSADMYREWQDKLGTDIDVCAIQLPGLDVERMNEKVPTDVDDFIETLETVLSKSLFDIPCVAFGHSWGALFAYRLASRLSKNPNVKFLKLFVSAFTSPTLPNSSITKILAVLKTQGYNRIPSYDEVKAEKSLRDSVVQAFKTVWDYDEELTKMSLQLLLGALKLVDSYKYDENERFDLPIVGFHGIDDYIVELDEMNEWENVTSGLFKLYTMAGDHQYVVKDQSEDRLIRLVKDELVNYMTDK